MNGKKAVDAIYEARENGMPEAELVGKISAEFKMPLSAVQSLASFYESDDGSDRKCMGLSCSIRKGKAFPDGRDSGSFREESCLGYCDHAPVFRIGGKFVTVKGNTVSEIEESTQDYVEQNRKTISEYIAEGGYAALKRYLETGDAEGIFSKIEKASLRGMGGAGFPVLAKNRSFQENRRDGSYLLVNAHEGEPGTFKDRKILELNPHRLLEGALTVAGSNGIKKIVIGLKKEYSLAYRSLNAALEEMKEYCSSLCEESEVPEIVIERIGGSYVTGEETALMEAIEGKRSEPRLRPPFPTEHGLYGKPTLVHNVETLSVISDLSRNPDNKVRKSYCLTGDVKKPGTYSAELGITARQMIEKLGETDSGEIEAFMPGGLSGGILPASFLDIRLDYDEVRKAGAGMGTGALIAIGKDSCRVSAVRNVADFFKDESCGKCIPCRYGTDFLSGLMERVSEGKASPGELEEGRDAASAMMDGSLCALGQAAGKVFLDSIKYFRNEMDEHMAGNCPAGTCIQGGN